MYHNATAVNAVKMAVAVFVGCARGLLFVRLKGVAIRLVSPNAAAGIVEAVAVLARCVDRVNLKRPVGLMAHAVAPAPLAAMVESVVIRGARGMPAGLAMTMSFATTLPVPAFARPTAETSNAALAAYVVCTAVVANQAKHAGSTAFVLMMLPMSNAATANSNRANGATPTAFPVKTS